MSFRSLIFTALWVFSSCLTAQAQTKVIVSLKEDPKVRDIPDSSIQDQINEQSKRNILLQKQNKLTPQEKKLLTNKARLYYEKGRELFKNSDFSNAQRYFAKAISLDASVDQYYHEWAITLYKNNNYRRSLAILANLDGGDVNSVEVDYYSGLNLFKMRQMDYALKKFKQTQDAEDTTLSPLAAMYAGISHMQMENYAQAKEDFQFILDKSNDPALDNKAESYIESIEQYENFQREAAKKWSYSLFVGSSYDENVLNVAANNVSTGVEAYRLLYGGSLSYKAYYAPTFSWIPILSASDIYSFNKNFESDATIQGTDPLQWDLSSPLRYYFTALNHNFTLVFTPGYQQLYMSLGKNTRGLTFSSAFLRSQLSTSHMDNLYTDYKLDFSNDTSHIVPISSADDQSAQKITLGLSNTYLLNKKGSQTVFSDLFYVMNSADGDNNTYKKSLLNIGYSHPLNDSWVLFSKVEYFHQDFSDSSTGRVDDNISGTLGANYSWSQKSTLSFSLLYMDNSSSVSYFSYDKFALTTTWSFNSSFF
ncbi:tetratricopeptide repeat protein [bacterium]|nr:tetratricopeptide repeat protein [bacterium]